MNKFVFLLIVSLLAFPLSSQSMSSEEETELAFDESLIGSSDEESPMSVPEHKIRRTQSSRILQKQLFSSEDDL